MNFEDFYDSKIRAAAELGNTTNELFYDAEQAQREFVARWLMIAVTRPISSLYIHVEASDHPLTKILRSVADECGPEIVTWFPIKG